MANTAPAVDARRWGVPMPSAAAGEDEVEAETNVRMRVVCLGPLPVYFIGGPVPPISYYDKRRNVFFQTLIGYPSFLFRIFLLSDWLTHFPFPALSASPYRSFSSLPSVSPSHM